MTNERVAIITPSYRNDFELAADLSRSIDAFVRFDFEHILIVPERDQALFAPLAGPKRRVLSPEAYLRRHGFFRLPLPVRVKLPFLAPMKFREQYYGRGAGRLSGWLMQQIVKMSAPDFTDASLFVFADSDVVLIRPFTLDLLWLGDRLHLQQHPRGDHLHRHAGWRLNAHRLLGIDTPAEDPRHNYIGNVIPWKRDTLLAMTKRIEAVTGKDWRRAVAATKEVSEYILYGEYVTQSLGEESGHKAADRKLYNSVWSPDERIDTDAILAAMEPQHVALHIQSTNAIPLDARRQAVETVRARLAQDQAGRSAR